MNLKIYSIVYNNEQIVEYEKYDNSNIKTIEQRSYLFEYNPIIDIIQNNNFKKDDLIGIFSWKFPYKTLIFKKKLEWLIENNKDFDVYGLCKPIEKGRFLQWTEKQHKGFLPLFQNICKDLKLECKEPSKIIYSNFFVAKYEIYRDFVNNIICPAIILLETKYKEEAWKDSNYKSGVESIKLKEISGLSYYPMHVFILERLISLFLENNKKLKFKQLV